MDGEKATLKQSKFIWWSCLQLPVYEENGSPPWWGGKRRRGGGGDRKLRGMSFCARGARKRMRTRTRSRRAGTVWDSSFPESDSCCVSHGVPPSPLWPTVEQTGHLRNKHQVQVSLKLKLSWHQSSKDQVRVCLLQMTSPLSFSYCPDTH